LGRCGFSWSGRRDDAHAGRQVPAVPGYIDATLFSRAIARTASLRKVRFACSQADGRRIDQAGGLAFGIRNIGNYLSSGSMPWRTTYPFEFVKAALRKAIGSQTIKAGQWHRLRVAVDGSHIADTLTTNAH